MSEQEPLTLTVGRIIKPHGIRGELVVEVRTDSPERRFVPGMVLGVRRRGDSHSVPCTVTAARPHAGRLLMCAEEVDSRAAAEDLRGALLTVLADELEGTDDPDEFHDHELVGLRVVRVSGASVGTVREVVHNPAGELLVVAAEGAAHELLVPFVSEIVPEIDLEQGRLVVDPPEGLLDQA